ncbi:hypothetical protein D3C87_2143320 [compost metagenome]
MLPHDFGKRMQHARIDNVGDRRHQRRDEVRLVGGQSTGDRIRHIPGARDGVLNTRQGFR